MPAAPQTPAKTQSAGLAPERSLTQRMDALKRANEILLAASGFFARELDPRLPW